MRATMKITMTDTVEAAHTVFSELEDGGIAPQPGLVVRSQVDGSAAGMPATFFILSLAKGASIILPDRLAKKQIALGYAEETAGFRINRKIPDGAEGEQA